MRKAAGGPIGVGPSDFASAVATIALHEASTPRNLQHKTRHSQAVCNRVQRIGVTPANLLHHLIGR